MAAAIISLRRQAKFHYRRCNDGRIQTQSRSSRLCVDILQFCERIKGHYSLVNQLDRSASSIGANIHEANYAHSKADFIAKFQIALKECYETEYLLELIAKAELADRESITGLYTRCESIRRMLIASINTAKQNASEK